MIDRDTLLGHTHDEDGGHGDHDHEPLVAEIEATESEVSEPETSEPETSDQGNEEKSES